MGGEVRDVMVARGDGRADLGKGLCVGLCEDGFYLEDMEDTLVCSGCHKITIDWIA